MPDYDFNSVSRGIASNAPFDLFWSFANQKLKNVIDG